MSEQRAYNFKHTSSREANVLPVKLPVIKSHRQARYNVMLFVMSFLIVACVGNKEERLPIFGEKKVEGTDTVYHTIADFKFVNQDSVTVTPETFQNKIYVTDFFFTSCRTICPIMKTQM